MEPFNKPSERRCCHGCGTQDGIAIYPDPPEPAWCPDCCPEHDYEYDRSDRRWACVHCDAEPPNDWFDFYED